MSLTKNDIKEMLGGLGCASVILAALACILLIFPLLLLLGGMIWGCAVYAVWNWVVVPVAGVPALTYWWQCVICGAVLTLVFSALKGVVTVKRD